MSAEPHGTEDSSVSRVAEAVTSSEILERLERVEQESKELREENEQLRNELEKEREQRKQLESIIEIRGAASPDEADVEDIWIAGHPAGKYITENKTHRDKSQSVLFGVENRSPQTGPELNSVKDQMEDSVPVYESVDGESSNDTRSRDLPFPLYRMMADLQDGQDAALDKTQRRAARIFERFVKKAKGVEGSHNVFSNGKKYTIKTEQAREILEDEDLLDVKEQSKARITGRVMREVQRFTIVDTEGHEDCDDIDGCSDHGVLHFRSGKPHTLTVRKGQMKGVVRNASVSDKDVRTRREEQSGQKSAEEESADDELDELSEATVATSDD